MRYTGFMYGLYGNFMYGLYRNFMYSLYGNFMYGLYGNFMYGLYGNSIQDGNFWAGKNEFIWHIFTFRLSSISVHFGLIEPDFNLLSNCKGYDRSDSFPFDYEPYEILFGSHSGGKQLLRSHSFLF